MGHYLRLFCKSIDPAKGRPQEKLQTEAHPQDMGRLSLHSCGISACTTEFTPMANKSVPETLYGLSKAK